MSANPFTIRPSAHATWRLTPLSPQPAGALHRPVHRTGGCAAPPLRSGKVDQVDRDHLVHGQQGPQAGVVRDLVEPQHGERVAARFP